MKIGFIIMQKLNISRSCLVQYLSLFRLKIVPILLSCSKNRKILKKFFKNNEELKAQALFQFQLNFILFIE